MKRNIAEIKALGCHGIVSGVLTTDNTIDIERTRELIALARPDKRNALTADMYAVMATALREVNSNNDKSLSFIMLIYMI